MTARDPEPLPYDAARTREVVGSYENEVMTLTVSPTATGPRLEVRIKPEIRAAYAGVTVKAIRHYHQRGLLDEPPRDRSGYQRYGAEHALRLVKIKTLADAGVPLARVKELLAADPDRFAALIAASASTSSPAWNRLAQLMNAPSAPR